MDRRKARGVRHKAEFYQVPDHCKTQNSSLCWASIVEYGSQYIAGAKWVFQVFHTLLGYSHGTYHYDFLDSLNCDGPLNRAALPASPKASQGLLPRSISASPLQAHVWPPAVGFSLFEESFWTLLFSFTNTNLWFLWFHPAQAPLTSVLKISIPTIACLHHLPQKHTHTSTGTRLLKGNDGYTDYLKDSNIRLVQK